VLIFGQVQRRQNFVQLFRVFFSSSARICAICQTQTALSVSETLIPMCASCLSSAFQAQTQIFRPFSELASLKIFVQIFVQSGFCFCAYQPQNIRTNFRTASTEIFGRTKINTNRSTKENVHLPLKHEYARVAKACFVLAEAPYIATARTVSSPASGIAIALEIAEPHKEELN
jgi:hypothetical protein